MKAVQRRSGRINDVMIAFDAALLDAQHDLSLRFRSRNLWTFSPRGRKDHSETPRFILNARASAASVASAASAASMAMVVGGSAMQFPVYNAGALFERAEAN